MATYDDLAVLDGLTKKIYGKGVHQAVPDNIKMFYDLFPFAMASERLGASFSESVNLGLEQGVTRSSGTAGVVALNSSIASVNKQALVDGCAITLLAQASWDLVSKARAADNTAFASALTQIVDNTLLSHRRHQVADLLYGGTNIGVISAGATSATQTLTKATTAAGLFYGSNGALFDIYDPTLTTKRNSSPLSLASYSVDPTGTSRTLTFGASVTTTTADVLVWSGTVTSTAITTPNGLSVIAGQTGGTLFAINQSTYPMFQGYQYDAGSAALTLAKLDQASIGSLVRGYTGKLTLLCNPVTFSNISIEEAARIHLVGSATSGTADVGFNKVNIMTSAGAQITVQGSPWIKEGEAYLVPSDRSLRRIGSCDLKLGGPADPQPTWRRIEGYTGYSIPTFSLSAMFTAEPWKLTKITGIVNS